MFGMGICLDSFLWTLAILPVRVFLFILALPIRMFNKSEIKIFFLEKVANMLLFLHC